MTVGGAATGLRAAVLVVLVFGLVGPIAAGVFETFRAAFGSLPALGLDQPWRDPWRMLLDMPGVPRAVGLSLWTGGAATVLSLVLALGGGALLHGRVTNGVAARWLVPILAAPHAAIAIGLAFVLAPSGWVLRLVAPVVGLAQPPATGLVNDPWGVTLILGLMVKETPFLLLVMLAALTQIPLRQQMKAGQSLGYGRAAVWARVIVPQLWPLIRLPVMVVLAYALSVVDMALVLGPSNPPVLAVLLTRVFSAPDLALALPASAGAVVQVLLVGVAFGILWAAERLVARVGLWRLRGGNRGRGLEPLARLCGLGVVGLMLLGVLALVALALWSVAWRWPWPHVVPQVWSLKAWQTAGVAQAFGQTLWLACATTGLSVLLAILWLEAEDRTGRRRQGWLDWVIYLPLLLPQIGFLYGLNVLFLKVGLAGGQMAVIWAQALFVFPYVMIALRDPWRALDPRLVRAAASLGAGPWARLWRVKLPVLLAPVLTAAAIGVAVSVAQYLPTLFMGAGRIVTLTTEAVTLSSGSDRRVTGVYATLQAMVPFAGYLAAFAVPALFQRNRAALKGALR